MSFRTTEKLVREVLLQNYDCGSNPSLVPSIRAANVITTRLVARAVAAGYAHTTDERGLVETWLSAYFYSKSDPLYVSKSTGGASGTFLLPENPFLLGAKELDGSGLLAAVMDGKRQARAAWLGKRPSEQTDYSDRD